MDLKFKDIVKITKVGTTKDPMYKTAIKGEWKSGEVNNGITPPLKYTNEGIIHIPPKEGKNFSMFRTKRGSIKTNGHFMTSIVQQIKETVDGCVIYTDNSVYRIEKIGEYLEF